MNIRSNATPAQRAAAKAKKAATAAFNRANGIPSVHAQRAARKAARAAAAGQTTTTAPPPPPRSTYTPPPPPPPPAAPRPTGGRLFAPAAVNLADLKLAALVALEAVVKAKFANPANRTEDARKAYETYTKCKALALNNSNDNEAGAALRAATLALIKMTY